MCISFSAELVTKLEPVPAGWDETASVVAAVVGTEWLRSMRSAILAVPAAMVKSELNYMINPRHPRFQEIMIHDEIERFSYDSRLL